MAPCSASSSSPPVPRPRCSSSASSQSRPTEAGFLQRAVKGHASAEDVRVLLEGAARGNPAAAHGFEVGILALETVDERLPRAVLWCAFSAGVQPRREWDLSEAERATRME